jgi:hypothetical protein
MFYSQGDISFEPHETVVSMEYLLGLVLALLGGSVKMQVCNSCKLDFGCLHGLQPKIVDIFIPIGLF